MCRLQPVQQEQVARPSPLATRWSRPTWRVLIHWKSEKLPLRCSTQRSGNPGIQETNYGLEHPIRGGRVAPMNPEHAPAETEHYRSIGVGNDAINVS